MTAAPRIYVASLSDYNAGSLHGRWIDANQTAEEIQAEVTEMLGESSDPGAEEWAIHDYEGFGPLSLGEWESFETVAALAEGYNDHGEAFLAYVDHAGGLEYASDFEDAYCGTWRTIGEYAEELAEDIGAVNTRDGAWPYSCIDWERAGRDLEMGGDNFTVASGTGTVFVFRTS